MGSNGSIRIGGKLFSGSILSVGDNNSVVMDGKKVDLGAIAGQDIRIEILGGSVTIQAEGNVTVHGDVHGPVTAGMSVSCDDIHGDVKASMSVNADDITGNVTAGMSVNRR